MASTGESFFRCMVTGQARQSEGYRTARAREKRGTEPLQPRGKAACRYCKCGAGGPIIGLWPVFSSIIRSGLRETVGLELSWSVCSGYRFDEGGYSRCQLVISCWFW